MDFIEVLRLGGDSAEIYKGELNPGDKVRVTQGVFKDRDIKREIAREFRNRQDG